MDYLPINLSIKNKPCLVVGGGNVALRKARQLMNAGALLTVVAPEFHSGFLQLAASEELDLIKGEYHSDLLKNNRLIIAATDNAEVNKLVFADAEQKAILVNVVDQPELCRFIMPSVIDRSPLTIAISSSGSAPVFARMLREKIEWLLPKNIGAFLIKVNKDRITIAERYPELPTRRKFWETFFENHLGWSVSHNVAGATPIELVLDYELTNSKQSAALGSVALIDLGTGELDDLTVKTFKLLQKADEVHLSANSYQWLKNIIRRDADCHFLADKENDLRYLKELSARKKSSFKKSPAQIVVVKRGHSFETDKQTCAELFQSLEACQYQRIAAINERCPL